jgi:hypothetical protein
MEFLLMQMHIEQLLHSDHSTPKHSLHSHSLEFVDHSSRLDQRAYLFITHYQD